MSADGGQVAILCSASLLGLILASGAFWAGGDGGRTLPWRDSRDSPGFSLLQERPGIIERIANRACLAKTKRASGVSTMTQSSQSPTCVGAARHPSWLEGDRHRQVATMMRTELVGPFNSSPQIASFAPGRAPRRSALAPAGSPRWPHARQQGAPP